MAAERRWALWLQGLALLWGRAGVGLAHLAATAPPAPACSEFSQRSCEECLKNVVVPQATCLTQAGSVLCRCSNTLASPLTASDLILNSKPFYPQAYEVPQYLPKYFQCLWCYTNNTCIDYPVRSILPPSSLCSLSNARWGVCWINFEALIIAIAVVAGLILVSITVCCCYCCYCRRRSRSRPDEEEERLARKREEQRLQSLQRKHERKMKHDEIRKKYGLLQDSDNPYSRLENE